MTQPTRWTWTLALGGALLLTVVLTTELYVWVNWWPITISWREAFVWSLPNLVLWLLLVPVVVWWSDRYPIEGSAAPVRAFLHVAGSALASATTLALVDLSDRLVGWSRLLGAPNSLVSELRYTVIHLPLGMAVYWVTLGARHALRYQGKYRETAAHSAQLQAQLVEARLETLRSQLQPHFLFNTLNSIAVLMRRDPTEAERMLHRLSELLRATLDDRHGDEIDLQSEIDFVRHYAEIEGIRFHDRLSVEFDIDAASLDALVPPMLLQPLVENAIRHGIAPKAAGGTLRIATSKANDRLTLEVQDNGTGFREGAENGRGIGLGNIRRRLETQYPGAHQLSIASCPGEGTTVRITLPFRPAPIEEQA